VSFTIDLQLRYMHTLGALRPYFDGLKAGQARASRCPTCKRTWFPPRLSCPQDHTDIEWITLAGRGQIVSVTAGASRLPLTATRDHYIFALVALDGADNLAFGRAVGDEAALTPGRRVRLTKAPEPAPHPAQCAYFVPDKT